MCQFKQVLEEFNAGYQSLCMLFAQFLKTLTQFNKTRIIRMAEDAGNKIDLHLASLLLCCIATFNESLNQICVQFKNIFGRCFFDIIYHDVLMNKLQRFSTQRCPNETTATVNRLYRFIYLRQPFVIITERSEAFVRR